MPTFEKRSVMPVDAKTLYRWHARPGAFERLTPPWQDIEVVERQGTIEDGDRMVMKMRQGPVPITWEALHTDHIPGEQFVDRQQRGPFRHWTHTHRFEALEDGSSLLVDQVDYALPMGSLGKFFGGSKAEQTLERIFAFRHRRTREDLIRHSASVEPMTVAVTGSTGLIGSRLCAFLETGGHRIIRIRRNRRELAQGDVYWSPADGVIEASKLEGIDAVVHLAGEPVAERWTGAKRRAIEESRIEGTRLLSQSLAMLSDPPEVFASASAVGYYGDRGDERLTEESSGGKGFLARVCRRWEAASDDAASAGIRTVSMRIGVVLSPAGGALPAMLSSVRYGMASRFGDGKQYVPWIDIDDLIAAMVFVLVEDDLAGPINLTGPEPEPNKRLLTRIGDLVAAPALVPVPGAVMKLAMGPQFAAETVLTSQRVIPDRLQGAGFEFFYDNPGDSMAAKLGFPTAEGEHPNFEPHQVVADAAL